MPSALIIDGPWATIDSGAPAAIQAPDLAHRFAALPTELRSRIYDELLADIDDMSLCFKAIKYQNKWQIFHEPAIFGPLSHRRYINRLVGKLQETADMFGEEIVSEYEGVFFGKVRASLAVGSEVRQWRWRGGYQMGSRVLRSEELDPYRVSAEKLCKFKKLWIHTDMASAPPNPERKTIEGTGTTLHPSSISARVVVLGSQRSTILGRRDQDRERLHVRPRQQQLTTKLVQVLAADVDAVSCASGGDHLQSA